MRTDRQTPGSRDSGPPLALRIPLAVAVILLICAAGARRIWGADFWWQLKTGEFVRLHGPPTVDVFSYLANGRPWIELRWLYCLGLYETVQHLGYAATVIIKILIMIAAFTLATKAAVKRLNPVITAAVLVVALLASSQRFFIRPELVTYLFLATYLWILQWTRRNGGRLILLLPLLQVIWTNAHTLFALGPSLVGAYLLVEFINWRYKAAGDSDSRRKVVRSLAVLVLCVAACFVNPYGWHGAIFPFQLLREIHGTAFKEQIGEFKSTLSFDSTYVAVRYFEILVILCAVSVLMNLRRLDPFLTIVAGAMGYLAFTAIRNLPLFSLAAVPFVLQNLHTSTRLARPGMLRLAARLQPIAALLVLATCGYYMWDFATDRFNIQQNDTNQFGVGIAHDRYPLRAVEFLRKYDFPRPIFSTMRESSYLLSQGYPVFIDPRLEVYGEEFFERYLRIISDDAAWREAEKEFGFQTAVIGAENPDTIRRILQSPGWRLCDFSPTVAVLTKGQWASAPPALTDERALEIQVASLRQRLPVVPVQEKPWWSRAINPAPYNAVAGILLLIGQPGRAERFFRDSLAAWPAQREARMNYANLLESEGRADEARSQYETVLDEKPDDWRALWRRSQALLKLGQLDAAERDLRRSVEVHPENAVGWAFLGKVEYQKGRIAEAAGAFRTAIGLTPNVAAYHKNLAKMLLLEKQTRPAIEEFEAALKLDREDVETYRSLATLLLSIDQLPRARAVLDEALARWPRDESLRALSDDYEKALQRSN